MGTLPDQLIYPKKFTNDDIGTFPLASSSR